MLCYNIIIIPHTHYYTDWFKHWIYKEHISAIPHLQHHGYLSCIFSLSAKHFQNLILYKPSWRVQLLQLCYATLWQWAWRCLPKWLSAKISKQNLSGTFELQAEAVLRYTMQLEVTSSDPTPVMMIKVRSMLNLSLAFPSVANWLFYILWLCYAHWFFFQDPVFTHQQLPNALHQLFSQSQICRG